MNIYNQRRRYYDALLKKYQIICSVGVPVEVKLKILCHGNNQVQGDIYTHVIWIAGYKSVYLYTGVLNYGTVQHMSSLLVYKTHLTWSNSYIF
jgi:hypothetical protein